MELPPPHVLLQLDAIIVAQRESEGNAWHPAAMRRASTPSSGIEPATGLAPSCPGEATGSAAARDEVLVASMASGWVTVCTRPVAKRPRLHKPAGHPRAAGEPRLPLRPGSKEVDA